MKIVEAKPFLARYNCKRCQSVLEADMSDVRCGSFGANYGGDTPETRYYIECPVCGTNRFLKDHELTPAVYSAVRKRG